MKFLTWLVLIMGSIGFILIALSNYNDSASKRVYAQAAIISAQSQARQDTLAAMLPYTVMGIALVSVALIVGLIVFGIIYLDRQQISSQQQPVRMIETRLIIMPMLTDNVSNRKIYKRLSAGLGDE